MTIKVKKVSLILAALTMLAVNPARAVRPFITDDASLIGYKRIEIANWMYISDMGSEFWHSANLGLTNWSELTVAGFWGFGKDDDGKKFSYTVPLLQAKFLLRDYEPNSLPGVTFAIGSDLPWGKGAYIADGYGSFGFASATQCFGEDENVLIHAQAGGAFIKDKEDKKFKGGLVFGLGTQVKIYKGFHGIAEIVNGDPYIQNAGAQFQMGVRQFVSDKLQVDCAYGSGIGGDSRMSSWITAGIRYVLSFNKDSNFAPNGRKISQ